ncbi:hypothetical protein GM658_12540 [Pseudoduganella eburnea]|uniref:Uncharacterized protein n=1 Tax=Massilia eburnea TaxID=1776165 RepID=A0A6L6QGT7_9BURK|nr:hypothetical protein [Massilia eburnea]MTW11425.1 hypothetical protein [Massilia eburnea]
MNQVKVKILKTTVTAQYGTLAEGAQLRTSPEFASHLVDDCGAAEYVIDAAEGGKTPTPAESEADAEIAETVDGVDAVAEGTRETPAEAEVKSVGGDAAAEVQAQVDNTALIAEGDEEKSVPENAGAEVKAPAVPKRSARKAPAGAK